MNKYIKKTLYILSEKEQKALQELVNSYLPLFEDNLKTRLGKKYYNLKDMENYLHEIKKILEKKMG